MKYRPPHAKQNKIFNAFMSTFIYYTNTITIYHRYLLDLCHLPMVKLKTFCLVGLLYKDGLDNLTYIQITWFADEKDRKHRKD